LAYAELLAARGARVVVNDLGGSMEGVGTDATPAQQATEKINQAGGSAVADTSDISSADGAQALVDAAIETFGGLDIIINNAGIMQWSRFPDVDEESLARHLAVHTLGAFHVTRAAWGHLRQQGYGRIVMTTSSGVFGLSNNTAYATAKAGVIGLTRSVALAGAKHGIKVNLIAPAAVTRMGGEGGPAPDMPPALVAPMAAYLAHEDCPVTGEMYAAGAGRFARIFIASTPGWVQDGAPATIEDVANHWEAINDEQGYTVPPNLMAWSADFLSHLEPPNGVR
jgi:NAD(P)-dependent dehydrogenase (short-subunit alcohol dehydrogenase family)